MSNPTCSTADCDRPVKYKGLCSRCYSKAYRLANLEKAREQERAKAVRSRERNRDVLLARKRADYAADPDKFKIRVGQYRAANLAQVREAERLKSERARRESPDAMRAMVRESLARWRAENPVQASLRNREYLRARRAKTAGGKVDYAAILVEFGMVCHICSGEIESFTDLHMDHVVPLARGGRHEAANIRPAHAFCNLHKGARLLPKT